MLDHVGREISHIFGKNVERVLTKQGLQRPSKKYYTPLPSNYRSKLETSPELKSDGVQLYQQVMIGILRWAVKLGRVDILLEVALMSGCTDVYLYGDARGRTPAAIYCMFGDLKTFPKRRKLAFDFQHPRISERMFKEYN
jgi:hypothetical protein